MNSNTYSATDISRHAVKSTFDFKRPLSKKPKSNKGKTEGNTSLRMVMRKMPLDISGNDATFRTIQTKIEMTKRANAFRLSIDVSPKATYVALTVSNNGFSDNNKLPTSNEDDSAHYSLFIANQHDIPNSTYVGYTEVKTTEIHNVDDEDDDIDARENDVDDDTHCDNDWMVYMSKHQDHVYVKRSDHRIMSCKNAILTQKTSECPRNRKITNVKVQEVILKYALAEFEKNGCFEQSQKLSGRHVQIPQQQEYKLRLPQMTPVPLYPNDRNEQININPFFPLLNSFGQWPNESEISPSQLAEAGFHCEENGNTVGCRSCGIKLTVEDFNGNDPKIVHRQRSPTCPAAHRENNSFVQQETTGRTNISDVEAAYRDITISGNNVNRRNELAEIDVINEEHRERRQRNASSASNNIDEDGYGAGAAALAASGAPASATSPPPLTYQPRNPNQISTEVRRETFRNWPGRTQDIDNLVSAGFFYTGESDIVRCFHCDIGLAEWDPTDDPWVEHARHSPDCPHLRSERDGRFILEIQRSWAEIYTPKHSQMSETNARLQTFSNWPRDFVVQTPEHLAAAGFFYTGETDTVRCHYCDGGLREWEPNDDPWTEHAKWFPFCKFVIKVKGLSFIQAAAPIEESDGEEDNPVGVTSPPSRPTPSYEERCRKKDIEKPMMSAAVESVKDFGYGRKMIKKAILLHVETSGKREFNAKELMDMIFKLEENEASYEMDGSDSCSSSDEINLTPKAMAKENEYLKSKQLCDHCQTRDKRVVFRPCGHISMCESCAESQKRCTVCSKEVESRLKIYI